MVTPVSPGRPPRSGMFVWSAGAGTVAVSIVVALILLPVPAVWFTRWLPCPVIVRWGTLGNRIGPFLIAGPLVGFLARQAEHPAPHSRHHGRMGGAGVWAVSVAVLYTLVMSVMVLGQS
ncbi:MAG: hypothetical protein ACP5QO_17205 [Clostridia bacterium]